MTADQIERLISVLAQIRDRLPAPPQPHPISMFGYSLGQDQPPDDGQVRMARAFLGGELHDWSTRAMPVVAWNLAREIVRRERCQCDPRPPDVTVDMGGGASDRCGKCGRPL